MFQGYSDSLAFLLIDSLSTQTQIIIIYSPTYQNSPNHPYNQECIWTSDVTNDKSAMKSWQIIH